jgi:hypothetical protein
MEPDIYIHKGKVKHSEIHRIEDSDNIMSQIVDSDHDNCRIIMYYKNNEQGNTDGDSNYQRIEIGHLAYESLLRGAAAGSPW